MDSGIPVKLVVTTPDAKQGRGLQTKPTPVKIYAESINLAVIAPEKLKDPAVLAETEKISPDYFVVASYGKLIPPAWLKIPKKLSINVHPSLLPKYRGAAPLNWPILNGDAETGVCLMEVVDKLDAGDVFSCKKMPLTPEEDSLTLSHKLSEISYDMVMDILLKLKKGQMPERTPQKEADMTYARKLAKEDGKIDWNLSAEEISRKVRGLLPWPGAYTFFEGQPMQILKARTSSQGGGQKPGEMISAGKQTVLVQTGKGAVEIEKVKPAGKNEMTAGDFARGKRLQSGAKFGQ